MNNSLVKVTTSKPVATSKDWDAYDFIVKMLKERVAPKSQRIYEQTLNKWSAYCERKNILPLDFHPAYVSDFLKNDNVTFKTRSRELSILRKAAETLAIMNYGNQKLRGMYEALKIIKAPKDNAPERQRRRRALDNEEIKKALAVWDIKKFSEKKKLLVTRNHALIALMFATGLRRDEISKLLRDDINFSDATLKVRHGKRDKERDVTIVNGFWVEPLNAWIETLGHDRKYLFPPLFKNRIGKDVAMHNDAVYRAIKHTEKLSGVVMSPHDTRRTHATRLLTLKAKLRNVQDQLGHEDAATTLKYDSPAAAKHRREEFTLGLG